MSPLSLVAALGAATAPSTALPDHPGLLENLEFQAVGLLIVMGALFLMYLVCAGVGAAFQAAERARRPAIAPVEPTAPAVEAGPEVPVVVIAAAVAAVVDQPHRVVKVEPVAAGWSLEGRRQLLSSHQPRK